jgi:large subunit ribosomal protein L25
MEITLAAETGRPAGSRRSGRLRADGQVPGVVYGLGSDPVSVTVSWPELRKALVTEAGLNALITLDYDGHQDLTVVKELQRHPVRRNVLHVDFLRVDRDAAIEVEIPVIVIGEAKDVESAKGLAEQHVHSLTVKAKPGSIPTQFEIDITALQIGEAIHVGDIDLPDGVTTEIDLDTPIVAGVATRFTAADGAEEGESTGEPEGEGGEADAESDEGDGDGD